MYLRPKINTFFLKLASFFGLSDKNKCCGLDITCLCPHQSRQTNSPLGVCCQRGKHFSVICPKKGKCCPSLEETPNWGEGLRSKPIHSAKNVWVYCLQLESISDFLFLQECYYENPGIFDK